MFQRFSLSFLFDVSTAPSSQVYDECPHMFLYILEMYDLNYEEYCEDTTVKKGSIKSMQQFYDKYIKEYPNDLETQYNIRLIGLCDIDENNNDVPIEADFNYWK